MSLGQTLTAPAGCGLSRKPDSGSLGALFPFVVLRALRDHRRRRRDYRHLLALPDYLLEDAGVTRAQVLAALRRRPVQGAGFLKR